MPNAALRQRRNLGTTPPGSASSKTLKQTYVSSDFLRIRHVPEVHSAADDRCRTRRDPTWAAAEGEMRSSYGVVVLSVNVSVFV